MFNSATLCLQLFCCSKLTFTHNYEGIYRSDNIFKLLVIILTRISNRLQISILHLILT